MFHVQENACSICTSQTQPVAQQGHQAALAVTTSLVASCRVLEFVVIAAVDKSRAQ